MTRFLEAGHLSPRRKLHITALIVISAVVIVSLFMVGKIFAAPTPVRLYDSDLVKQNCTLDIKEVTLDYEGFVHTGAAFRYSDLNQQSMTDFFTKYPDALDDNLSLGRRFIVQPIQQDLNSYCGITQAGEYGAPILLIQDENNPALFEGRQMYAGYDQFAVTEAPVMRLTLTSQAGSGEINASLSYVPPAAGSSQTDGARTTENIVVTSGATFSELTGGSGGGGGGGGGAPAAQLSLVWNDIKTIYRCSTTGSGASLRCAGAPEETYVLQKWGDFSGFGGRDDRAIYYLTSSTLNSPSGRPRQELVGMGGNCQPRLTLDGSGNGSLDITFSDVSSNDINSLRNALNTSSTGGAGARFYNSERTLNANECIDEEGDINEVSIKKRSESEERYDVWRNDLKKIFFNAVVPAGGAAQIDSVFGPSAGGNELKYSMSYLASVTAQPSLFLLNSEFSECSGSTDFVGITQMGVTEAPAQWATGDIIDVSWKIADPDDLCSSFLGGGSGTVVDAKIRVMDASAYTPPSPETGGGDNAEEPDESCESNSGILGWVMCPVAGLLDNILGFLDSQIQSLLALEDKYFEGVGDPDKSGDKLHRAWVQVRNIAYVVLIPIMLVMVVGTALGFEIFSAYTIKKALPRMVIAIIFITLSWYICVFLINFFNIIGSGVKGLVTTPFSVEGSGISAGLNAAGLVSSGDQGWSGWAQDIVGGGVAGVGVGLAAVGAWAVGSLSIGIILSTLGTAVLILGVAFIILVARQMFIIAMLLLAPLAILAWIFPGNDKLWKLWWNSFSKLLMMFPLIMLLIGLGDAFGTIIGGARSGPNESKIITIVMVIAAVILPYAAIPFTFKFAGGVFGNLAGMVNDKNKGMLDRLKKGRNEERAQGWSRFKAGTGTGAFQKNKFTRGVGTRMSAGAFGGKGFFGYGQNGRSRLDQLERQNSVDQIMKNPAWNGVNQDDNALHAGVLLADMNKADAIKHLMDERKLDQTEAERAVAAWQASGLGGRAGAVAAAQQLVSTGTGYKDLKDMSQTLARASGGNKSTASALAGFANSETKKVGRHDLAPSFGRLQELTHNTMDNGGVTDAAAAEAATRKATESSSLYELLNGKSESLKNQARAHAAALAPGSGASEEEKLNASAFFKEIKDNQANAKGANRDVIAGLLNDSTLMGNVAAYDSEVVKDTAGNDVKRKVKKPVLDPLTGKVKVIPDSSSPTGTRQVTVEVDETVTKKDLVDARKRAYERPDPNNIT